MNRFLHVDKMSLEEVKKLMKDLKEYHLSNPDSSEFLHDDDDPCSSSLS